MATPPRQDGSEKLPRASGKCGRFIFSCNDDESDDEQPRAIHSFHMPTRQLAQEQDVIDDCLQTATTEAQDVDEGRSRDTGGLESQGREESSELFVSNDEEQPEHTPPPQDAVKIKPDPDEDDCCMIIDSAQASSDAQAKWAKPLKFTIDLTDDNQDANETKQYIKAEPTKVKFEQADDATAAPQNVSSQPSCLSSDAYESMNKRITDLKAKALHGQISEDELNELIRLTSQLGNAKSATERVIASESQSNPGGKDSEKSTKAKKARKPPIKTAAEYWAQREKDDMKKRNRLQAKNRKRPSESTSTSIVKRGKANHSSASFINDDNTSDEETLADQEVERQISEMIRPLDAILERAKQGELPAELDIKATRKEEQLRQMREKAPEYFDELLLEKQELELRESTKAWGPRKVRASNGKWEVKGVLSTPLHNHQIVVGAWMMGRELRNTSNLPRGGILADAMGLGKTIEALSCIAGNPAPEELRDKGQAATLVVCPSRQMIGVWIAEIKKHCTAKFAKSAVQYKPQSKMDIELLGSLNIV